jgi:hypothetical protein
MALFTWGGSQRTTAGCSASLRGQHCRSDDTGTGVHESGTGEFRIVTYFLFCQNESYVVWLRIARIYGVNGNNRREKTIGFVSRACWCACACQFFIQGVPVPPLLNL